MWLIPTKKEIKKEFAKVKQSFKERDLQIQNLKEKVENNSLKIATLEGSYLILSQKSQVQSHPVSDSLRQSQGKYETKLLKHIKQNKKSLVMAEIVKLLGSCSVIEMFNKIVLERGLCSKASFYRYIDSLKSQKLYETKAKIETN